MHFLRLCLLGIFTFLVLVNGLKYFFDYDLVDNVESVEKKKMMNLKRKSDDKIDDTRLLFDNQKNNNRLSKSRESGDKEVFHIGDNIYTYDEAKLYVMLIMVN